MFRRFLATALPFAALICFAVGAAAQTPTPEPPPVDVAVAPATAPAPGTGGFAAVGQTYWARSVSFGTQFTSAPFEQGTLRLANSAGTIPGLTGAAVGLPGDQYAIQMALSLFRATNLQAIDIEGGYTYADADPVGRVKDEPKFSIDYDFRQRKDVRYFYLVRYAYYEDPVRHIDYSHQIFGGIGFQAVATPKVKMGLIPVLGTLREHKDVPTFDDKWLAGWGGLEQIVITPNPFVQIEQRLGYVEAFNHDQFRILTSYIAFKGRVTKNLSVTFNLSQNYDNVGALSQTTLPVPGVGDVVVEPNTKTQLATMAGIEVKF